MFFSRTWFCSLRPQVLTEIGSVLFDRRSQRNSVPFPSSARSKQNSVLSRAAGSQRNSLLFPDGRVPTEPGSVHPGQLHHNGTRFCSPGRPILNGTRFCSPRRLVLNGTQFCSPGQQLPTELDSVPGWQLPAEPGSVPEVAAPNGTRFRSRGGSSQRNSVPFPDDSS